MSSRNAPLVSRHRQEPAAGKTYGVRTRQYEWKHPGLKERDQRQLEVLQDRLALVTLVILPDQPLLGIFSGIKETRVYVPGCRVDLCC